MTIIPVAPEFEPAGHYSQLVEANGFYFLAGQLPNGTTSDSSIEVQFEAVMERTKRILLAANLTLNDVVKTTVYISDVALWPTVNGLYARYFGAHKPARAIVPVSDLHYGYKIEIELMAVKS